MNQEQERKDFEDLKGEFLRMVREHKIPIGIFSIVGGAAMIASIVVLLKLLEEKRGRPPEALADITTDLEAMVANHPDLDRANLPEDTFFAVAAADEIGQIMEDSDGEAISTLDKVVRIFGFPPAQSLRDQFLVASAATTTFFKTIFNSEGEKLEADE